MLDRPVTWVQLFVVPFHNHVSPRRLLAGAPVAPPNLVLGFLIGALVIIFSTNTVLDAWRQIFSSWTAPGHAIKVTFDNVGAAYRAMFTGSVVDPPQFWHSLTTGKQWDNSLTPLSETLTYATPLVIAGTAVGIAFQTGIFNIGANGQAILGGITGVAAASLMQSCRPLSTYLSPWWPASSAA